MRQLILFFSCVLISLSLHGQNLIIHGSVVDGEYLQGLSGVHVFTELTKGTVTDIDGNFHLNVEITDTLHFSMLGYDPVALIITDTAHFQSMIISLKEKSMELDGVQIVDFYKANTIIKRPPKVIYKVPGIRYSNIDKRGKYLYLGSVFNSYYAAFTMNRTDYKQHKKLYKEYPDKYRHEQNFQKAKEVFYEALEIVGENFDEYYMVDFFNYTGLTVTGVANRTAYDLVKILPLALEQYYAGINKKTPSDKSNGVSNK